MPRNRGKQTGQADGYFVTGGTGFIGRHLIERLLQRPGRTIFVLVRERSLPRFTERLTRWHADATRVVPVVGDLTAPRLGLTSPQLGELHGQVGHFFNVAGLYDMTASDAALEESNVAGTRHAIGADERMGARCFHHVSSIAAAGRYPGTFREDMFDEAIGLHDPYFRTKHASERVVRHGCSIPWRIYRPSLVVGHSVTGEMDKVDGPYYFFPAIERIAAALPSVLPLPGIDGGYLNLVPVDFVAAAIDHIAHLEGLDGKTFHLVDPEVRTVGETLDAFAEAAGAPHFSLRVTGVEGAVVPLAHLLARAANGVAGKFIEQNVGIPLRALDYLGNPTTFDCQHTLAALAGSGIQVPRLDTYARRLWLYWERNLNTNTTHARTLEKAVRGKHVLITGGSSGIGRATAVKLGAAGAHVILVARDTERLEEVRSLVERVGGRATAFSVDLTNAESVERLCHDLVEQFGGVDVLINNAGRSIRRSLRISEDRFHDFTRTMDINYFGALRLILGLVPAMRRKKNGHIINISSIGAQVGPPRFSAYIASKAALDGFSKCAAPELLGDGIDITTVYMPLVKTEMIAPTRLYDSFSVITPAQAADLICSAIVHRPKQVTTMLGLMGQISSSVAPRVFDVALYLAYRLFPDSAAARGEVPHYDEQPTNLGRVFARLLPGVHW
jgi:NAD(P)-dependent dehydrogenase (short-subunit alcohol dehydrogenase family)